MADMTGDDYLTAYQAAPEKNAKTAIDPAMPGHDLIEAYQAMPEATASPPPTAAPTDSAVTSAINYGAGLLGSAVHGLSAGLDSPLDAATAKLFPGSSFAKMRGENQLAQKAFDTANPAMSAVAQGVGSIPTYAMGEGALRAAIPLATRGAPAVQAGLNLLGSSARNAAVSGGISAGTADDGNRLAAGGRGAAIGAIAGPAADVIGQGLSAGASLLRGSGGGVPVADAALGRLAINKYGIPINAPDLTSNPLYRIANDQASKLPFSGAEKSATAKQMAWQGAIAKEMGEPGATSFTSNVMSRAKARIGQDFDDVAARTSIPAAQTTTLANDLAVIHTDAGLTLPDSELKPLTAQMDNIRGLIAKGNGTISGDSYQALTRSKAPLDLAESSADPNVRHFASKIRDALDDAFVRSASPADQAALTQAKYQYRVMRTVDPLAAGSRDGNITPDAFMQKVLTASRRFDSPTGGIAYTGGGNMGELASIGKLMRAPPQTGSADRMMINLLAGGGAAATGFAANPLAMLTVPGGLVANRMAQSYLHSPGLANRLINSSLAPGVPSTGSMAPLVVPPLANAFNR